MGLPQEGLGAQALGCRLPRVQVPAPAAIFTKTCDLQALQGPHAWAGPGPCHMKAAVQLAPAPLQEHCRWSMDSGERQWPKLAVHAHAKCCQDTT